jgi:glycosyltransferase involved in cell wall biosynthesis
VFLLPSQSESFGLAALEAMACGVPVVANRVGGLPEVVDDGVSGALVSPGDVDEAARRAIELLEDRTALANARKGAVRVAQQFAADRIVPQYEALYRRVLGR